MSVLRKIIILDSNLLVSAFLNPRSAPSEALQIGFDLFSLATSKVTLEELLDVLERDKFDNNLSKEITQLRT